MNAALNQIQVTTPKTNTFDLTHDVKMTGRMGNLMPCMVMECVPGDRIKLSADNLIRFAPLISPVMHRIDVYMHYFFVPNRLVWENWENFITGNEVHEMPYYSTASLGTGNDQERFADYMGIPPNNGSSNSVDFNAIPFAAYQKIYNDYYRDQNLIPELDIQLVDGDNNANGALVVMRRRAWEHDYFTSCLPFAQKGNAVDIPLGVVTLDPTWTTAAVGDPHFQTTAGPNANTAIEGSVGSAGTPGSALKFNGLGARVAYDPDGTLLVEPTTINDLRAAFKLQEWLEKNARGGTRYIEQILVHFGVRSSDKRLQRPEYITGTKAPVIISEVLNTAGETLPQGNMAGHGVSVGNGHLGNYYCEEHGYIIGIVSVIPKSGYSQGIPRMYLKKEPTDFYWPSFANLGEQAVQKQEVYGYNGGTFPTDTFGYMPRYSEYKHILPRIAGDFRTTLDFWHLNRIFGTGPELNQDFIEVDPEECERIFAVQDGTDNLYMHIVNKVKANRPMPVYGTPML